MENNNVNSTVLLKSKINAVKARIKQIKESSLFTDNDRETLLKVNNEELDKLQFELDANSKVTNPESL